MEKEKTTLGTKIMIIIGAVLIVFGFLGILGGEGDSDVIIGSMVFIVPGVFLLGFGINKKKKAKSVNEIKMSPKNESCKDSHDIHKVQDEEEEAVYCFETKNGLKQGTIKFFDDRYKFVSKKGEIIECEYSNVQSADGNLGFLNMTDKDNNMKGFTVEKGLLLEIVGFVETKIKENLLMEANRTEEGVVFAFRTNTLTTTGMIYFFEDRYKYTNSKGKKIEIKYSELKDVKISVGCLELTDTNSHTESFPIEKELIQEVLNYVHSKIAENIRENSKTIIEEQTEDVIEQNETKGNKILIVKFAVVIIMALLLLRSGFSFFGIGGIENGEWAEENCGRNLVNNVFIIAPKEHQVDIEAIDGKDGMVLVRVEIKDEELFEYSIYGEDVEVLYYGFSPTAGGDSYYYCFGKTEKQVKDEMGW